MSHLTRIITVLVLIAFPFMVHAQESNSTLDAEENNGPLIDLRCQRERTLSPDSAYVMGDDPVSEEDDCKPGNNTQEELICRDRKYSGEDEILFGPNGLNLFGTDVVFTKDTIPGLFRAVITVFFAVLGMRAGWEIIRALNIYLNKINSGEDTEGAKEAVEYALNGLWGIAYAGGTIILTWIVFWVLGYKGGIFDFGTVINRNLSVSCEGYSEAECRQYNLSCEYESADDENDLLNSRCKLKEVPDQPNCT